LKWWQLAAVRDELGGSQEEERDEKGRRGGHTVYIDGAGEVGWWTWKKRRKRREAHVREHAAKKISGSNRGD
jgi:hypothetical protein